MSLILLGFLAGTALTLIFCHPQCEAEGGGREKGNMIKAKGQREKGVRQKAKGGRRGERCGASLLVILTAHGG